MTVAAQQLADGKEKIAQGVRELVEGAEDLLRAATNYPGEGADAVRSKLATQVTKLKDAASSYEAAVADKYQQITESADGFVRERPWQAVGVAAVAGVVIGALLARR